jgi:hypothetical protein
LSIPVQASISQFSSTFHVDGEVKKVPAHKPKIVANGNRYKHTGKGPRRAHVGPEASEGYWPDMAREPQNDKNPRPSVGKLKGGVARRAAAKTISSSMTLTMRPLFRLAPIT